MKKIIFILNLFLFVALLSGCANRQASESGKSQVNQVNKQSSLVDKMTLCSDLCVNKIQSLCADKINQSREKEGLNIGGVFEVASCQLICEADWDETVIGCVSNSVECSQITNTSPFCVETEVQPKNESFCLSACEKYAKCAGFNQDVTKEEVDEVYKSCAEICKSWSLSVTNCINASSVNTPEDCAQISKCSSDL